MHLAYDEFRHILWETKKPIKVNTDNKALTRFFRPNTPPSLWNFCEQTLHFNSVLAHVPNVETARRLPIAPGNST